MLSYETSPLTLSVDTNGDVTVCSRPHFVLGNIYKQPLEDLLKTFSETQTYALVRLNVSFLDLKQLDFFNRLKKEPRLLALEICIVMIINQTHWEDLFSVFQICRSKGLQFSLQLDSELSNSDEILKQFFLWMREFPEMVFLFDSILPLLTKKASRDIVKEYSFEKISSIEKVKKRLDQRSKEKKQCFCSLPFGHLEIFPEGDAFVCCWLPELRLGNIHDSSIAEIWSSEKLKNLRDEFLRGTPKICAEAMTHRHCQSGHHQSFDDDKLVSLGLNLGHQCNLRCVMCGVVDQKDDTRFATLDWAIKNEEVLKKIKHIVLKGGEPFLQERAYAFISYLTKINPECRWSIYTNGQHHYEGRVAETIRNLNLEFISVSVDSLNPSRFASIRRGGDLRTVMSFAEKLSEDISCRPIRGVISFAAQAQNIDDLEEVAHWAGKLGFDMEIIPVIFPEEFSLKNLDPIKASEVLLRLRELKKYQQTVNFGPLEAALTSFFKTTSL